STPSTTGGRDTGSRFGEHVVEPLLIGLTGSLGASYRLGEFLLDREAREARLDPANRIHVGDRHGGRCARAGRAGRLACRRSLSDISLGGCDHRDIASCLILAYRLFLRFLFDSSPSYRMELRIRVTWPGP